MRCKCRLDACRARMPFEASVGTVFGRKALSGAPIDASELLDVGEDNRVYWETRGDPQGRPVLVVHGGPGSGRPRGAHKFSIPRCFRAIRSTMSSACRCSVCEYRHRSTRFLPEIGQEGRLESPMRRLCGTHRRAGPGEQPAVRVVEPVRRVRRVPLGSRRNAVCT